MFFGKKMLPLLQIEAFMTTFESKKALTLNEIDQAVRFNEPIGPDHPFYTDFSEVRGDFEERIVYRILNVDCSNSQFKFNPGVNSGNKTLFFLGGMRGSGKTSELAKYAGKLNRPDCFFCVTCNIDEELDMNDVEYMDILIFQLEKLTDRLKQEDVKVDDGILQKMQRWFEQREQEIKKSMAGEIGLEFGGGLKKDGLLSQLLAIFGELKMKVTGTREWAETIRKTLRNRFPDFAGIFNDYIQEVNIALRKEGKAQEVLFIVDGLEKTLSADMRRKIILDESNRLSKIKAYTIFTLPIELMRERQKIMQFSTIESFPFVKLFERNGDENAKSFDKFFEFVYKRVDEKLFESSKLVKDLIRLSGGSPRELLRILETSTFYADEKNGIINRQAFDKAAIRLANQTAQYLTEEEIEKLKEIRDNNKKGKDTTFDDTIQGLLENIIIMEYNDGTYKRANPIVELSNIYKQRIGD